MPIPYLHQELFELSPSIKVKVKEIDNVGPIMIIDNFYAYPNDIALMLEQSWVPAFHMNGISRNFKDYYDCRYHKVAQSNTHPRYNESQSLLFDLIKNKLKFEVSDKEYDYTFNLFKWINTPASNDIQFYPHKDSDNHIASVIYLNENEELNHGTAFYEQVDELPNEEAVDIRVNIYEHTVPADVIEAKFNRCIVYPSWYWHGAYIDDHEQFVDNWRYNQVYFMKLRPTQPKVRT